VLAHGVLSPTIMTQLSLPSRARPTFSIASTLAIACAIGSFFVGSALGLALAAAALFLGLIGILMSFAPSVRGGITSIFAILVGVVGIIAAIVRLVI